MPAMLMPFLPWAPFSARTALTSPAWNWDGAIFGSKHPRIVRVNNFYLEAVPEGYILILHNNDVPGVVGAVGTILGKNGINIAGMELGRSEKGGNAISFTHVDDVVSKKALTELRALPQIVSAELVKL
jgi:D-3-phosphoglycerate dehydrogenase